MMNGRCYLAACVHLWPLSCMYTRFHASILPFKASPPCCQRAVASFHHCFTATRVVVPTVARLDRFAAFIPSAPAVVRIVFIWVFIPPDCNIMLISDWNPAVFWDLVGVLEVQGGGVPSPTHSHQEQMAVAGLAD